MTLKDYTLALQAHALNPTPQLASQIQYYEDELRGNNSPTPLVADPGNVSPIVETKKSMELLFATLEERGIHQPGKLTEYELYSRLEHFRKPAKE